MAWDFLWRCRSAHRPAKGARQVRRERLAAARPVDVAELAVLAEEQGDLVVLAAMASPIHCLPSSIWMVTA